MLEGLDSNVRPPNHRQNRPTLLGPHARNAPDSSHAALAPCVDLRQAYAFARGIARLQPNAAASGSSGSSGAQPGHRLVWVRGTSFACMGLRAAEEAFAIVGRHTQCGVVLPDDPTVALRHVLVRSMLLPSGGVALRVLDLRTGAGFLVPDGSMHTSIFAEGPIALAIGEYAFVALPNETSDDQLPGEMPLPVMDTPQAVRDQLHAFAQAMSPYRLNARPLNRMSRITLMPSPVMVGEPMPQSLGRLANGGRYALTLSRRHRSATVMITDEDLARGFVIGRSEKCHAEMLRRITDETTSRVHLLVMREGDAVWAYDLASTQGTHVRGEPTRRTMLFERATLTLGRGENAVQLGWQSHP